MGNKSNNTHDLGEGFNTLAQSGTSDKAIQPNSNGKIVCGKGADANDKAMMQRMAKRKLISQRLALSLVKVSETKGASPKHIQGYWNTYHCLSNMTISKGRVYGDYCKNRCCTVCLAIKKANHLNRYLPVIKSWDESYFLTLTMQACKKENLDKRINDMLEVFAAIKNKYKTRHQRGKGQKIVALRALECNFNPKDLTYNPHFHIIVKHRESVMNLIDEWCKSWDKGIATHYNQVYRKLWSNQESTLIETIKYGSKVFTEPDVKNKKKNVLPSIYPDAFDNILTAFKKHRLIQSCGFQLPKQPEPYKTQRKVITQYDEAVFDAFMNDWVNTSTGELFTGYKAPVMLSYLLNEGVNMDKS